jgi:hypothetical protein
MTDLTIRQIINAISSGQMRIPAFQRGFVWDADRVAFLMDSIFKGYPFGSILLWRTKERLKFERKLGSFQLPEAEPEFPVDYILDGQQRLTSLFGVFQTDIKVANPEEWTKIYFDHRADPDAQESQFLALEDGEVDLSRHFLLRHLFDTTEYRKATKDFNEDLAVRIDKLQAVFKEARVPIQIISTEDRTTVAIVFERVNQRGIELDTLQLLSAWAWSEEFDLQRKFTALSEELEPFGFSDIGNDTNLLLRCCSAVLASDASTKTLINLNGGIVRERFQEVVNGLMGAIDFLQQNLNVYSLENLPYDAILVPLSVFFAVPGNSQVVYSDMQRRTILRWFWKTCFYRRYSRMPQQLIQEDIQEMIKLRNKQPNNLGAFSVSVTPDYFKSNGFRISSVRTKTFVLMLAQKNPLSFISGAPISLAEVLRDHNRHEFHHLYPRSYLKTSNQNAHNHSCLANFCFLSQSDNNRISGDAPSKYRGMMPKDVTAILAASICPQSLFTDDYKIFINERCEMLAAEATRLVM